MSLLATVREWLYGLSREPLPGLVVTATGFEVQLGRATLRAVVWSDVVEITAFKVDLVTTDDVRFRLRFANGNAYELSEEQPGFQEFTKALETRFPSVRGWQERVIKPAFSRNETVLYRGA